MIKKARRWTNWVGQRSVGRRLCWAEAGQGKSRAVAGHERAGAGQGSAEVRAGKARAVRAGKARAG